MLIDLSTIDADQGIRRIEYQTGMPLPDGFRLINPAAVRVVIRRVSEDIYAVQGTLDCVIGGECARCLGDAQMYIQTEFSGRFESESDDPDSYLYEGNRLDLSRPVSDALHMALPYRLLCKQDCKGLCPVCGNDRNKKDCGCAEKKSSPFDILKDMDWPKEV